MDSNCQPGIDTPFSPSIFDAFQMGSTAANAIIVEDEKDKENSAHKTTTTTTATTTDSECPAEPPKLLRSRPFGIRLENVFDSVYTTLVR